ncbi:MAG: cation:proton antiporter [Phycisphaerae bacterium]
MTVPFSLPLAAGGALIESLLFSVLVQLGVIILVARVFASLFRAMRQPAVVGEIVAGIVLGPSLIGKVAQGTWAPGWVRHAYEWVFHPWNLVDRAAPGGGAMYDVLLSGGAHVMPILAQLGLVLLLFLIGLEFDFGHLRARGRAAVLISVTGILLPFGGGLLLGHVMHGPVAGGINELAFVLFLGVAMSITALPILGRMMMEMGISRTRVAAITITAAAIDDAAGWILLAAVSAVAAAATLHQADGAGAALSRAGVMLGLVVAFAAVMGLVVRPLMKRWIARVMARNDGRLGANGLAVLLAVLFACALATSQIGIFSIFGAFMLGAVLSTERAFRDAVHKTLGDFVSVFFLPIFFTYTGLRTDVGTLGSPALWGFAAAVSAVAILGKLGGGWAAARLGGLPARESVCVGVMMNTRALMELVVVNVGYNLGVIPASVFCMLVMMAVLTTVMTTPLLQLNARGTELEPGMVATGFLRPRPDHPLAPAATPAPG